jgi:uncharacterized protein YecE (DUF72 family)
MLYIGCPLWSYKAWVGSFYPEKAQSGDFLRLYGQRLTTVEGNTVFYALPSFEVIQRWCQETPANFRFCPKVSRDISHAARLDANQELTRVFVERMRSLGERLGPIFLQLPPAFGPQRLSELRSFLEGWPADLRLAVEVRHPHFFAEPHGAALQELLETYHVARVLMDTRPIRQGDAEEQEMLQARERKPDLPLQVVLSSDFAFVRYIGHPEMIANQPFLDEWASQLATWHTQGVTVYVFCHCPFEEHSPAICAELYRRISELVSLPQLPWFTLQQQEPEIKQQRLF